MFANKIMQQSLRGLAAAPKNPMLLRTSVFRAAVGSMPQIRSAATSTIDQKAIPGQESAILAKQRLARPVSPHLTIYRPQITWCMSGLHRITGSVMAGSLYLFAAAYLVSPLFGWHLESASLAAAFGAWPLLAKVGVKFTAALTFAMHLLNGIRHLAWDAGYGFAKPVIAKTGWGAVAAAVVAAGWLTFY